FSTPSTVICDGCSATLMTWYSAAVCFTCSSSTAVNCLEPLLSLTQPTAPSIPCMMTPCGVVTLTRNLSAPFIVTSFAVGNICCQTALVLPCDLSTLPV